LGGLAVSAGARRMMPTTAQRFAVAAALASVAPLSVPAKAPAMEIGMQDDQAIVYRWHDRPLALQQFREVGGTRVRINIMHRYGPERGPQDRAADALEHPIAEYDAAIDAIRDAGLLPQLTLVWYGQSDPDATAAWMANAAAHFGAGVDRY